MKKSELRKIIREVINEQPGVSPGYGTTYCTPGPNCVAPELFVGAGVAFGNTGQSIQFIQLRCPQDFQFQHQNTSQLDFDFGGRFLSKISYCVPDIGSPGDMAGHGSPDNPFVPGMGFEDQFIDQITGPGGPFGGPAKSGGSGKGKPIRESKKRRK